MLVDSAVNLYAEAAELALDLVAGTKAPLPGLKLFCLLPPPAHDPRLPYLLRDGNYSSPARCPLQVQDQVRAVCATGYGPRWVSAACAAAYHPPPPPPPRPRFAPTSDLKASWHVRPTAAAAAAAATG
jgi:hypothetical protein